MNVCYLLFTINNNNNIAVLVSSRFAETRFAEIRVRGWCLPDSSKPDSPKPVSPKLGFRVRVRLGLAFRRIGFRRIGFRQNRFLRIGTEPPFWISGYRRIDLAPNCVAVLAVAVMTCHCFDQVPVKASL